MCCTGQVVTRVGFAESVVACSDDCQCADCVYEREHANDVDELEDCAEESAWGRFEDAMHERAEAAGEGR